MNRLEWNPGPAKVLETYYGFVKNPFEEIARIQEIYGDRAAFHTPIRNIQFIFDPLDAMHVMQKDTHAVDKKSFEQRMMQAAAGESLFTLPGGDQWKEHRARAQPAFGHDMMPGYRTVIEEHTQDMFDRWDQDAKGPEGSIRIADVQAELMQVTLKIISDALFHHTLTPGETQMLSESLTATGEYFGKNVRRLGIPWRLRHIPTSRNRAFFQQLNHLFHFADTVLEERRMYPDTPPDLLSHLMQDGDRPLTEDELRHNILAFLIAGHATTTSALTWSLINLSKPEHTAYKDQLGDETYAKWCFEESMRLNPPAWIITRKAMEDVPLDEDMTIPKNAYILIVPYLIHRNPKYWEDPDTFRPERFDRSSPNRSTIFSFGKGPRACIGSSIAMMEGPHILSMLANRYDFAVADADDIKPGWDAIMLPDRTVQMLIQPR